MLIAKTIIANGQTTSPAVSIGQDFLGFTTPGTFSPTSMLFEGSVDGTTYLPVYYEGSRYSVTVTTSSYNAVDPRPFLGLKAIKLVAGSAVGADAEILVSVGNLS